MQVLIVGSGGREHALARKISSDSTAPEVFCAPGNAGTASCATNIPLAAEDVDGLLAWARQHRPNLTIVGPEAPLCAGMADRFQEAGLRVFGPTRDAARLEGSKAFAKEVMEAGGVPTAHARAFTDPEEARAYVRKQGAPIVVKADGLAAGKGVSVCRSIEEAKTAISDALEDHAFGEAGASVLVEECLTGEEASILALVDGERIVLLASSQDHKPVLDDDLGPNTGGMGAYSPAPVVGNDVLAQIREQVFERTVGELRKRGITFKGVMYAGLMMAHGRFKVLEFNVRFGDPECQAILPRWRGDLLPALEACVDGDLRADLIDWTPEACVCVVMTSGGYPGRYEKGKIITGLDEADAMPGIHVIHAGTALDREGNIATSGGRVLGVTALGTDIGEALDLAYDAVSQIHFDGAHYRHDIGQKALDRKPAGQT